VTTSDDDPPPILEGEPAFLLDEGIAYVRGWAQAQHAVAAFRDVLGELGMPDAMPHLRADVSIAGKGIIEIGRITPQTADLILQGLRALAAQHNRSGDGCAA
jgi:hypothetical protein